MLSNYSNMQPKNLAVLLVLHVFTISTNATPLPTQKAHVHITTLNTSHICANTTSQPRYTNYTQPYTCAMKHDFAILGLYYDSCVPLNTTAPSDFSSTSSPPKPPLNANVTSPIPPPPLLLPITLLCCDPTYTNPPTFDTLCIWGNGTNMAEWEAAGHPAGSLPTTSEEQIKNAKCFVGPIIHPRAKCVQIASDDVDWGLGELRIPGPGTG